MQDTYANLHADPAGSQGREFGLKDLKNGWSVIEKPVGAAYDRGWSGAFKQITDTTQNPLSDLRKFELEQNMEFTTDAGVEGKATNAIYDCAYSVKASLIIADFTQSPTFKLKENQPDIAKDEIGRRVPPLHRLSDTIWTQWRQLSGDNNLNAGKLRYIGRSDIANPDSKYIMRAIFVAARNSKTVPWPGLRYSMNQEQGQALLGTPNGLATAYVLIDHPAILGPRNPVVTIWTDGYFREHTESDDEDDDPETEEASVNYYMLWDMGDPNKIPDISGFRKSRLRG
ncbi:MAG: hypothetical protein Q9212_001539 [Teloschistes hypoglaucus]